MIQFSQHNGKFSLPWWKLVNQLAITIYGLPHTRGWRPWWSGWRPRLKKICLVVMRPPFLHSIVCNMDNLSLHSLRMEGGSGGSMIYHRNRTYLRSWTMSYISFTMDGRTIKYTPCITSVPQAFKLWCSEYIYSCIQHPHGVGNVLAFYLHLPIFIHLVMVPRYELCQSTESGKVVPCDHCWDGPPLWIVQGHICEI